MRRIALCAGMALITSTPAALAAPPTTVTVDSHITPVVRAFTPHTGPATLAVNLFFTGANGTQAAVLKQVILKFSYGAHLNGSLFPSCTAARLLDKQPCPKGSLIGTGTGLGVVAGDSDNPLKENVVLQLYNGPKGKSITFRVKSAPNARLTLAVPVHAPRKTFRGGTYNYQLTADIPKELQHATALDIPITCLK